MPTVAKTWVTWTPTSLLWQKKPTSRWPGETQLCSEIPEKGREGECLLYLTAVALRMVRLGPEKILEAEPPWASIPSTLSLVRVYLETSACLDLFQVLSNGIIPCAYLSPSASWLAFLPGCPNGAVSQHHYSLVLPNPCPFTIDS